MKYTHTIEALAPLVFRSGKPFGTQPGSDGAHFPLPSSLAGMLRTYHAETHNTDFSPALKDIPVLGPLLARRQGDTLTPLTPRPADVIYLPRSTGGVQTLRLEPIPLPPGSGCDLPDGLLPVCSQQPVQAKPARGPDFWQLDHLLSWSKGETPSNLAEGCLDNLSTEVRTHVAMDSRRRAHQEGQLFQTGALDLGSRRMPQGYEEHDHVFLIRSTETYPEGLVTLGGERRPSRIHPLPASHDPWPQAPADLEQAVRNAGGVRLTLLTPAIFSAGYRPGWLDTPGSALNALGLTLCAAAIERWQAVSGWDLAAQTPRASRKAVAAGAVYWFRLGASPPGFMEQLWLRPLSDHPQDQRDGFGLALPAPWTPPLQP